MSCYNHNINYERRETGLITKKKQKFVGYKMLVDPETGEQYPMQMNVLEERDFNFHKVWLQHLVNSLDGISNQRLRLAFWIIDHLDRENKLTTSHCRRIRHEFADCKPNTQSLTRGNTCLSGQNQLRSLPSKSRSDLERQPQQSYGCLL